MTATDRTPDTRTGTTHRYRFFALAGVFVVVQALIVLLCWLALDAVDIARAYVAGEGLYSKAQKTAVISLHQYASTGDAGYYLEFEKSIAIPIGDRLAREALERKEPDFDAARRGFLQGNIQPADIDEMSLAFVMLQDWGPFAKAVADWRKADALCEELVGVAKNIHARVLAGASRRELSRLTARVNAIDRLLTAREQSFTANIRETTQAVRAFSIALLLLGSVLLVTAGLAGAWRISRKGAESEKRAWRSEQRFKHFADVASDWFCELDRDLRISYLSDRFQQSTGVPAQNVIGHLWSDVAQRPWLNVQAVSHFEDLKEGRPFRGHVMRHAATDGTERFWSLSGTPMLDAAGLFDGYRATGSDISDLVQANQALHTSREAAEQANASKSAFLANMSHELRTPLNAIIGFSETMTEEVYGPLGCDRYGDYAQDIHTSGRHLLSLINDILDLSRVEAGKLELTIDRVCFSEIVENILTLCRERAASAGLRLDIDLPSPSPLVLCDPLRMKQVLINLVSNAVKFTPSGGSVWIGARIEIDGTLRVSVKDSGIGMSADDIAVALKPFGQVDHGLNRKYEGTGLGVPLTKTLIELHGGSFTIQSAPSQGTTVTFTLPPGRVEVPSSSVHGEARAPQTSTARSDLALSNPMALNVA